jgi:hypothetical protein
MRGGGLPGLFDYKTSERIRRFFPFTTATRMFHGYLVVYRAAS